MSNYPPGVTDSDPYFTDESEYEDEQAEGDQPLKTCVTCGKPFRYPPSDNKDDEDRCGWCVGKFALTEKTEAEAVPTYALVELLNAALVHPESAEGYIRRVIEELSDEERQKILNDTAAEDKV